MRPGRTIGVAAILASLAAAPADATFPGRDGRLAASGPFGCANNTRVVTMRPDGSDRQPITRCSAARPDWSADGARMLLYTRPFGLSVMAADGSALTGVPIAPDPPLAGDKPSFAPGGVNLAYTRLESGRVNVWRTRLDGTGDRRLGRGTLPRWSPRGGAIAIAGQLGGISLMRSTDGTLIRRLSGVDATSLDWAPGGRRLLYGRRVPGNDVDLFVIAADGTGRTRLTRTPHIEELAAVWSPSGSRIAFAGQRRPSEETRQLSIWTMTAAGERRRRIFNGRELDASDSRSLDLSWRPRPK